MEFRDSRHTARTRTAALVGATIGLVLLAGCHEDMWVQPKLRQLQSSDLFSDGSAMRPLVPNTVDRTHFWTDEGRYTGWVTTPAGRQMIDKFPFTITRADLERGQERFNIYCSPCHGVLGNGQGMIALRGLSLRRQPASYHTARLRKMPIGHFYDVMTNGYGVMFSYASRVEPDDRWRIAAYIRVLQRSQDARPSDLPPTINPQTLPAIQTSPPEAGAATGGAVGTTPAMGTPSAGTEFPSDGTPQSRSVPPSGNGAEAPAGGAQGIQQPAIPSGAGTNNNGH